MCKFLTDNELIKNNIVGSVQKSPFPSIFGILIFTTLIMISCSKKTDVKKISEGEIEYNIEYLDNEQQNPLIMLLPKKMTTSFANNSSYTLIEGFLGTFKLIYITNNNAQKNSTLFQMMDKKYYCQTEINYPSFGYQEMENPVIKYLNSEKIIAGYNCKKAIASFPKSNLKDIEIYYTDEIELKNPNRNNPFFQIKGVLMQFTVNLLGINMRIETQRISGKKIKPELFEIPNGFTNVSIEEMSEIVNVYSPKSDK